MVFVLVAHQRFQLGGRGVPIEAVFQHQFGHVAEVAFQQAAAFGFAPVGEAEAQIGFAYPAAWPHGVIGQCAHGVGQFLQHGKGQQLQEVKQENGGFHGRLARRG